MRDVVCCGLYYTLYDTIPMVFPPTINSRLTILKRRCISLLLQFATENAGHYVYCRIASLGAKLRNSVVHVYLHTFSAIANRRCIDVCVVGPCLEVMDIFVMQQVGRRGQVSGCERIPSFDPMQKHSAVRSYV
jgi:hypothetical protein